jgi:hypothetical protein
LDAVRTDLDRFDALIAGNADLLRLIRSPVFSADEQVRALGAGGLPRRMPVMFGRGLRSTLKPSSFPLGALGIAVPRPQWRLLTIWQADSSIASKSQRTVIARILKQSRAHSVVTWTTLCL